MKFQYNAKKGPGDQHKGEVEAVNERAAVEKIIAMGLIPVEVKPLKARRKKSVSGAKKAPGIFNAAYVKFFQNDVVLFFRYLADFLIADIPVLQSLRLTRKRLQSLRMSGVLEDIEQSLENGDALSDALGKRPDLFSELQVNMVRAGEVSGSLPGTVGQLAEFLERDHHNRLKVLGSLIYPALILCAGFLTVFVLLTWVIPSVMTLFRDMDQALPLMTRGLMAVSLFFARFWWLIAAAVIAGVMVVTRWYGTEEGRQVIDRKMMGLPGLGALLRESSAARFTRTLGSLLEGGVDIVPALGYAAGVVSNLYARRQLNSAADDVAGGVPVSRAFAQGDFFSESDISMISVGEETGRLPDALLKLAAFYETNTDRMIQIMTRMIEPALIMGLGMIILFVVLAMLMPIMEMDVAIR